MNSNPYATPESDVVTPSLRQDFPELTTKELRKFWNHSSSIRALVFLFFLVGVAGILVSLIMVAGQQFLGTYLSIATTLVLFLAGIGLMKRTEWGRGLSMVLCVLALIAFPLGTIIGILSLMALSCGKLFGPDRFVHRALDAELKHRKKNRVE